MRIQTIEHAPYGGPGAIQDWARSRGHELGRTRLYAGESLPPVEDVDLLCTLGGPRRDPGGRLQPWLEEEKRYIWRAMDAGRSILGVCLGAQLLSEVMGGSVARNPEPEAGWYPVTLTGAGMDAPVLHGLPDEFTAFHWHDETFAIPAGARWIGYSDACPNQAFSVGAKWVGLQFHLEVTAEAVDRMMDARAGNMDPSSDYVQNVRDIRAGADNVADTGALLHTLLDNIAGEIRE